MAYSGNPTLPKFDGSNYTNWSRKMKPIFMARSMWGLVTSGYIKFDINDVAVTADQKKDFLENQRKDNEALTFIFGALEEHIFPRVGDCETSKAAWDILKNAYEGAATAKLQTLRTRFENSKMNGGESVNNYITKVQDLVNQMKALGEDIPEQRIVEKNPEKCRRNQEIRDGCYKY